MKMQVKLDVVYNPNKTSVNKLKTILGKQNGVEVVLQVSDVTILNEQMRTQR